MKKIVLFLLVALFSINSYSQKSEGDTWREVAKYLFDEGFDRAELRNTVQLVRDMAEEISEKKKISKRTEKKLKNLSFSDDQLEILKTLSKKMSKIVAESLKKEDNQMNSFENNNQDRFNRARGTLIKITEEEEETLGHKVVKEEVNVLVQIIDKVHLDLRSTILLFKDLHNMLENKV